MGSGWIKIHRKITKHWVFKDSEYLKAWITILLNVAYEPGETLVKKTLLKYKKGESLKSIDTWGKMFGDWGKEKTRRFFNLLEKEQMISTKRTHITTHLSVCNWDSYQEHCDTDRISDEPLTVYQTSHTPATDKEVKERKEIKKEKNNNTHTSASVDADELFDTFWSEYPRKQGKGSAIKAWKKIKHQSETLEKITTALSWQKNSPDWKKDKGQYVPMPATYLNGMRWEDEPTKNNDDEKSEEDRRRVFLL